ncbi:hypothetical protein APS56_13905 [Pseudalgibacter alginicilyticus]|uniref:PKD domain-containing protein n=1 Tax=Pseudalgibacter alginicilyticus TaxID=1736674 RepID=A0A0P0CZR3_9FLAO|nr:hypothetical protein [Pseudalgibacter alginicilyticus]ALJ06156.1 hypothetical protein APS56_13905 [Pseudalgibacter alginicilyticus]
MKKFNKLFTYSLIFIASSLFILSCEDDDKLESDSGKVIPEIFNFNGPSVGFVGSELIYSVSPPRGGSEYIWTVSGAELKPIEGRTDKMGILFTQKEDLVTVTVKEKAFNGLESEVSSIEDIIVLGTPCEWTVDMQDAYADGWNGASLTFTVAGDIVVGEVTLDSGGTGTVKVLVPTESDLEISFNEGSYDEEVTYQVFDASGNKVLDEGLSPTVGVVYSAPNICP